MAQHDLGNINPTTTTGTQLATKLENFEEAQNSSHKGAARPSYIAAGGVWVQEVSADRWDVCLFDGDTDIVIGSINPTANAVRALPITSGGTGATDAAGAKTALGLDGLMEVDAANVVTVNQPWVAQLKSTYTDSHAIWGLSADGQGVRGESTNSYGLYGKSTATHGIYGKTQDAGSSGVIGYNHDGTAYGRFGFGAYGMYCTGHAHVTGDMDVGGGLDVTGAITGLNIGTAAGGTIGTGASHVWVGQTISDALAAINTTPADGSITSAKLASGAVGQGQLKTSLGSGHVGAGQTVGLPGGAYGFVPSAGTLVNLSAGYIRNDSAGSLAWSQRYVLASPPYDLGDGLVHGFIFAHVDAAGDVISTYVSETPPWVYNGPTDTRPQFYDADGVAMRYRRKVGVTIKDVIEGRATLGAYEAQGNAMEDFNDLFEPVACADLHHADMNVVPHPFVGAKPGRVVLLDPLADRTGRLLFDMLLSGEAGSEEPVTDALRRSVIRFDPEPLKRKGPPGVMQVAYR